jgi:hypothetical protein
MTETIETMTAGDAVNSDWKTKDAAHDRLRAELQPRNKTALFDALAAAGITHVIVSFDGYADSGQIENVEATARGTVVPMPAAELRNRPRRVGQERTAMLDHRH